MNDIFSNAVDLTDVPREKWRTDYIGDGYRSCCYMTDHDKNGVIMLFGFDKVGNRTTFICPHQSHICYNVKYDTETKDVFGNYVETRYFKNEKTRRQYVDSVKDSIHIIECDRPETEFLHEMFDDVALDPTFNKQPLRTFFYDIETEIGQTFEYPKTAGQRINAITIYDTLTEKYYVWTLSTQEVKITEAPLTDFTDDKFEIFYFPEDKESRLLQHFLNWWEGNYPDVTCGYNSQAFDFPYIVKRISNVLGEKEAKRLSPIGRVQIKQNNLENERANKQAEILVDVAGIFDADALILFRDKFKIISPLDGGYSLDNVGEALGLGNKIHYDGSLKDLYEHDWNKFINYNIRDVDLLRRIEEKCKMIPLSRQITSSGLCNYNTIYSSISYLIGSLSMFAKTQMNRKMTSYLSKKQEGGRYEGAFVFEPNPGIYNVIITSDFNSLYPNTIRSMNISPETYIGHLQEDWFGKTADESPVPSEYNDFHLEMFNNDMLRNLVKMQIVDIAKTNGVSLDDKDALKKIIVDHDLVRNTSSDIVNISRSQIEKLLEKYCIITRNNDILVKHEIKKGLVSEWSGFFFNKRKATKKEMAALEKKIYEKVITDPDEISKTEEMIQNLNDTQQAIKIMINSIYGCLGTSFSPIYNANLAQSITRQGKFCNRNAARYVNDKFHREFGVDDKYISIASGDTDSIFIHAECMADAFAKKNGLPKRIREWSDDKRLEFWDICENFIEKELTPWVRELVTKECHTNNAEVLRYALEYMADVGIYQAKKNYAVHKVVLEGRELADKIVYKGIELKKGNLDKAVKDILAPIYKNTLTTDYKEEDFKKYIREAYDKFLTMDVDDISFWKGYNTERKVSGFLQMEKIVADDGHTVGTTSVSAAGTYYNQLLEKLGIGDKYESIILGDKIRFVYVKCQKYPIKYIAYKSRFPKEFYDIMQIDYGTMFEKTVLKPLERYFIASGFQRFDPSKMYAESIDDL